jgi:hypothetical protein
MNISQAIKMAAQRGEQMYLKVCTVDSVDETACTVDCTPLDGGASLPDVQLLGNRDGKSGVVVFPEPGSEVIVGFLDKNNAVALVFSEVEKVRLKIGEQALLVNADGFVFNEGGNGGLVNIETLTDKINALVKAFNSHTHTIPVDGINVAGSAAAQKNPAPVTVPAISSAADELDSSDYEDIKVTH